ncbi:hypothetical protein L1994_02250 [Methanomicrobium antiquum]|jgi:hypothetical protein|uniref:Uncharacterized protein n=1 Tax=Methanomicrobium antiquum TaxID=487686 RepID=A0AAF0FSB7_9EURY|nr:hypothetical protein [Methanomicrobium antiquum]WFN37231.1 hypothetical protein L1994_02250 [Methanomicrobium antiquum]
MKDEIAFSSKTDSYRTFIDPKGTGHIRILKRVSFRTLVSLFREIYPEIVKVSPANPKIIIYISNSLYQEMLENINELLLFSQICLESSLEIEII